MTDLIFPGVRPDIPESELATVPLNPVENALDRLLADVLLGMCGPTVQCDDGAYTVTFEADGFTPVGEVAPF